MIKLRRKIILIICLKQLGEPINNPERSSWRRSSIACYVSVGQPSTSVGAKESDRTCARASETTGTAARRIWIRANKCIIIRSVLLVSWFRAANVLGRAEVRRSCRQRRARVLLSLSCNYSSRVIRSSHDATRRACGINSASVSRRRKWRLECWTAIFFIIMT